MAVNYFGKRRLEKIFFNYISDRKDLVKSVKLEFKKYGKENIIMYRKHRGSEWFEINGIYDENDDKSVCYKIHTMTSDKGCHVSMSEKHTEYVNDDNGIIKEVFYGHAYYRADFQPYDGDPKLKFHEICKTSSE